MDLFRVFLFSALVFLSNTVAAKELVIAADPWCPYNCEPNSDYSGYLVELTERILEPYGYKVRYINLPWKRAIKSAREGLIDGIFGAGRDEVPDFIFPNVPFYQVKHSFFTRVDSAWTYTGNSSLDQLRLGVIKDYSYGSFKESYVNTIHGDYNQLFTAYNEQGLPQLVRLLDAHRIDLLIEAEGVFYRYIGQSQSSSKYRHAGVASWEDVYVALSPSKKGSSYIADLLSAGFESFKSSNEHRQLLKKYMLRVTPEIE